MGCNSNSNSNSNVLDAGRTSNNNRMLNAVRDQKKCAHQQNILLNTINVSWFELDCKSRVSATVEKMMLLFGVLRPGCVFRYFFPGLWSM